MSLKGFLYNWSFFLAFSSFLLVNIAGEAQVLSWEFEDFITDQRQPASRVDIVKDRFDNVYASVWQAEADQLAYGFRGRNGKDWTFELVDSTTNGGFESAVAVDENGAVHIAYFENRGGQAFLKYANNITGFWEVESVLPDSSWGPYGTDFDPNLATQAAIDITMLPDGRPAIAFFDRRFSEADVTTCELSSREFPVYNRDYALDMKLLTLQVDGSWQQPFVFDVPYNTSNTCKISPSLTALPLGDRFGEFCQFAQTSDGRLCLFTIATHNHQLLMWSAPASDLSAWDIAVVDSVGRFASIGNRDFRLTFDYLDVFMDDQNTAHLVYGVSDVFGLAIQDIINNASDPVNRTYFYARVAIDSLSDSTYTPYYYNFNPFRDRIYRNNYSISLAGTDTVIVSHYNVSTNEVIYHVSFDQGINWEEGLLTEVITNTPLQSEIIRDSIFWWIDNSSKENFLEVSIPLGGGDPFIVNASVNESSGRTLSAEIERTSEGDRVQVVYNEDFQEQLLYGISKNGEVTSEAIDDIGLRITEAELELDAGGIPYVVYGVQPTSELRLAVKANNEWIIQVIESDVQARNAQLHIIEDSLHVIFYDGIERALFHSRSGGNANDWITEPVDNSSISVGQFLQSAVGDDGSLHIAYLNPGNRTLKYAKRGESGAWKIQEVSSSLNENVVWTDIKTDSIGSPVIVYREAIENVIKLARPRNDTSWQILNVTVERDVPIGDPLKLILDKGDFPWIMYNISGAPDELKLIRLDENGLWFPLSVGGFEEGLSGNFDLHLVESDLYVIGQKRDIDNQGIAILRAQEALTTDLTVPLVGNSSVRWEVWPNPGTEWIRVSISTPVPQKVSLTLFDMAGRLLRETSTVEKYYSDTYEYQLPTSDIAPGIYTLRLRSNDVITSKRIMIIR